MGEWIHSQISQHAEYGGIVPDIAVRQHLNQFFPLLDEMRKYNDINGTISEIAVTCGPGLIGSLGVGLSIAKTLGEIWRVPVVGVNHLRGHAYSPFMALGSHALPWTTILPHLGLLVSGGNTLLFEICTDRKINIIGRTMDDAVGEALDKGAKLLGFLILVQLLLKSVQLTETQKLFLFLVPFSPRVLMTLAFRALKQVCSISYKK